MVRGKPSFYWHYDTAEQLAEAYNKLKAAGFTVRRPRNSGWKILVIGKEGQQDLFEQVEKILDTQAQ